jgi:heterodisulfide reductase subunit C
VIAERSAGRNRPVSLARDRMDDIVVGELDLRFKEEVAERIGLEVIKPCFSCGSCTGICPVREVIEDFDPRLIIEMILLGMRKEVLSSDLIWFCCSCNCCFFVCPQGIRFSRVAAELQKMAADEGYMHEELSTRLAIINPYLQDLCRRTLFLKVREGFRGDHTMPCWRKCTK